MITYKYDLDIVTGSVPVIVPLKQYSDDCEIIFNIYSRLGTLVLEEGTTVAIKGTKPDGNGISIDAALSGNQVTVNVDKQMVAVAGKSFYELVFSLNDKELITTSFVLHVQRAALDKDTLVSGSVIRELVDIIDRTDEIIEAANKADTSCKRVEEMHGNVVNMNDNVNQKSANVDLKAEQIAKVTTDADTIATQALEKASNTENELAEYENAVGNLRETDERINLVLEGKIDDAYVEQGYLYLTSNGVVVAGPLGPFSGSGGGSGGSGGNNAVLTVTNTSGWLSKTISEGSSCIATLVWSSTEDGLSTGNGTLKVTVNGIAKAVLDIQQGSVTINLAEYVTVGSNVVKVTISDIYGNNRTINFSVTSISLSLTSSFDSSVAYKGAILFPFVPTGNVLKTMHFILDDVEIGTMQTSVSGRQQSFTITQQAHGAHKFKCYFDCEINGENVKSNELYYEILCLEELNTEKIIACDFDKTEVEQYSTMYFNYIVYDPINMTSPVSILVNDKVMSSLTVDRTKQTYAYRPDDAGNLKVEIKSGEVSKTYNLTVTESEIQVEIESEALALNLTSAGRSNNEETPGIWVYKDVFATFSNFNFKSDGWQNSNGTTVLRVTGDARVNIPYQIFRNDFRTAGKTIELKIKTKDVRNYDAEILSCYSGGRGLKVTAQSVMMQSEQSKMSYNFKDDEIVYITFAVEKRSENRLVYLYINGVCSQVIQYPENDDFAQVEPVNITIGSNDCTVDVYYIRVYDNDLTRMQVLDNWIASIDDVTLMLEKYIKNNVYDAYGKIVIDNLPNDLSYLILECPELPQFKGDKKTCSGRYIDPMNPSRSFTFTDAQIDIQGTTSAGYERKNYKVKFKNGFVMIVSGATVNGYKIRENSIATNVFTFKADVASSEGCNNVELARLYNDTCPYKTDAQKANSSIRQGIDGFPIVMFWNDGNETTFLGKYNFNNDKGTPEVFGFAEPDESWEVLNNTSERVLFKSDDFSGDGWLNDFEARYPEDYTDASQLQEFISWVKSTDREQATGNALGESVVYDGVTYTNDTAEYRLAKFKAEAGNYMELDSAEYYYLFTEMFLMCDSRAKNMFPSFIGSNITGGE